LENTPPDSPLPQTQSDEGTVKNYHEKPHSKEKDGKNRPQKSNLKLKPVIFILLK